jgi:hypothetical protein
VLHLVARLRRSLGGGDLCALLSSNHRSNAERWAQQGHLSCGQAAIKNGAVNAGVRLAQPLAAVLLFYRVGRPGAAGFLSFAYHKTYARGTTVRPLTVSIEQRPNAGWQIDQIGYEF